MKKSYYKLLLPALGALVLLATGCSKRLNLVPTNDVTGSQVYTTPLGYRQAIAKVYLAWATSGNVGGTGSADIPGTILKDEGNSDFLRGYWYLQCLSTDEAGWTYHSSTDPLDIHQMQWTSSNQVTDGTYYRSIFQITLANDFIRNAAPGVAAGKGFSAADTANIANFRNEARFIRAYQYWVLMDLYGNPPFADETFAVGSGLPKQIQRADLFKWLESELMDLGNVLPAPKANEYGRADQAAAWALLARMYLNAEVYTGTARYTDAITYCNKVIGAGYTLHPNYKELMLADNNLNTDEFILTIPFDGTNTQTWGGTTCLTHIPAGVPGDSVGVNGTWGCARVTQQFVGLFSNSDIRGQFYTSGQNLVMAHLLDVSTDGYSTTKFRNKTRTGGKAPDMDAAGNFVDIDFPLFRLGEIYLIYTEAVLRGGTGGTLTQAIAYYNALHTRGGNAAVTSVSLQDVLDERGRELFWECFRRTDLVRYNQFTTNTYLWAWKGNTPNGTSVDSHYNLFPIPAIDLSSNSNLKQNPGY